MSHIIKMNCGWRTRTTAYRFTNLEAPPFADKQGNETPALRVLVSAVLTGSTGFLCPAGRVGQENNSAVPGKNGVWRQRHRTAALRGAGEHAGQSVQRTLPLVRSG